MEQSQRSRTIEIPAIMRALHQTIEDDPKILTDPVARRLIDSDDDRRWLAPLLDHPFAKQWRAGFALRARYAEDCLAEGVQRGAHQYVVLGAGLDTSLTASLCGAVRFGSTRSIIRSRSNGNATG